MMKRTICSIAVVCLATAAFSSFADYTNNRAATPNQTTAQPENQAVTQTKEMQNKTTKRLHHKKAHAKKTMTERTQETAAQQAQNEHPNAHPQQAMTAHQQPN